jgi:DNA polymerase I-like protein with 3'-5' exonuclease and polymerase domains
MKYDIKMLEYHTGLVYHRATTHDTMCMHYVLDENSGHGLKDLAMRYTDYGDYDAELDAWRDDYCRRTGIKREDFTYDLFPFDVISNYASIDTAATWTLADKFWPIIKANPKLNYVYEQLLVRGTRFLLDIEEVGIPIGKDRLVAAGLYLDTSIERARQHLYTFDAVQNLEKDQGAIFNSNSVPQLRKLLFDYVGLKPTGKLTGTGAISTDAEVLEELADQHELPKSLLELRKLGKIRSSYVTKILPELDKDSRIRTNFNLVFTTSGRLSSSGTFNAQQIPRDDPIIKGCILAPEGYKIVSQD